jgi:hypothetical protein
MRPSVLTGQPSADVAWVQSRGGFSLIHPMNRVLTNFERWINLKVKSQKPVPSTHLGSDVRAPLSISMDIIFAYLYASGEVLISCVINEWVLAVQY